MTIPQDKLEAVGEFSKKITESTLKFIDDKCPEMTTGDLELVFVAITNSIRDQRAKIVNPNKS